MAAAAILAAARFQPRRQNGDDAMTRLRGSALIVILTCAGLLASITPAQAETFNGRCYGNNYLSIWLDASISYTIEGQWHRWGPFGGAIRNNPFLPESNLGNKNNVDLYLYQDGAQNWTAFSPDNIQPGGGFSANPQRLLPEWSAEQGKVIGIFDKPLVTDPQCPWLTPVV